jgi:hypothetical protein
MGQCKFCKKYGKILNLCQIYIFQRSKKGSGLLLPSKYTAGLLYKYLLVRGLLYAGRVSAAIYRAGVSGRQLTRPLDT